VRAEASTEQRGRWLREVWASTVGKKVIVGLTGVILAGYVVLHALGNLKAFQGAGGAGTAPIDRYAEWLRTIGEPAIPRNGVLWAVRALLVFALVMHVIGITQLSARNRAARAPGYRPPRIQRTLSSRTMMLTGIVLLAFVIFHLLQFTTRTVQVTPVYEGTVYANLYEAFQKSYFVAIYVIAVLGLGLHLRHALWSVTQTTGLDRPNRNRFFRHTATVIATSVALAFAAVPLGFWTGVLDAPVQGQQLGAASTAGQAP
jgi:succinate dehydrogenase cytochrome b subunit